MEFMTLFFVLVVLSCVGVIEKQLRKQSEQLEQIVKLLK